KEWVNPPGDVLPAVVGQLPVNQPASLVLLFNHLHGLHGYSLRGLTPRISCRAGCQDFTPRMSSFPLPRYAGRTSALALSRRRRFSGRRRGRGGRCASAPPAPAPPSPGRA